MDAQDVDAFWGCYTPRPLCNLLAGSLPVCEVSQFLLFDTKAKLLHLCHYEAGRCQARPLSPDGVALRNPRQLLLAPRLRVFASLEVADGAASVAVWQPSASVYRHLGDASAGTAKAISWSSELPRCAKYCDSLIDILTVLLADRVLLIAVRAGQDGPRLEQLEQLLSLNLSFPCSCLCWSNDGSQLLVGGKGQLTCFAWEHGSGDGAPRHSRHLLCAGECMDIQAAHANTFLCRIDQRAGSQPRLLLPGQSAPSAPRRMLVQEIENPQDGPSDLRLNDSSFNQNMPDVASFMGLQVVPCQRYVLPLKCSDSTSASSGSGLRLTCGAEREAFGELLAVGRNGEHRGALVVHGSHSSSEVQVWTLAPPHHWGRRCEWHCVATLDLAPTTSLRLAGLALWPGNSGLDLHAMLAESSTFGRPRDFFHRSEELAEHLQGDQGEHLQAPSPVPKDHPEPDSSQDGKKALLSIAGDVAGMRQEMKGLREALEGFRQDFSRLAAAMQALARRPA
ncbi:unnamed protein product [Effrenium voratum]|uniref:Uncharacterized protein n=1 Tax=Effrenium voratum TaxID=2562239 RepID=A0AA36IGR3_9DINO|nr:unnamed protein product [Effrenium voratum]CAJ1387292.1 unnamed protein product [Effrenium voratum]CAJ1447908.1 unnamed protein product [Effrenium voratum]